MKQLAFALLMPLAAFGQVEWTPIQVYYNADDDWQTFHWEVQYNGQVIAAAGQGEVDYLQYDGGYLTQTKYFRVPNECVRLTITDGGCNGYGPSFAGMGNVFAFQTQTQTVLNSWTIPQNVCEVSVELNMTNGQSCVVNEQPTISSCPSDINGDGLVGVGDLIIFMAEYGSTCN